MLYTYCLRYDNGSAPNPYGAHVTLVICKPKIRQVARAGDWIAGFGSANSTVGDISGKLVYAMRVSRTMTMPDYDAFCRHELPEKMPDATSAEFSRRLGDSIYDFSTGYPRIRPGVHGERERERDMSGMNALLSDHFYYFGDRPIDVPRHLQPIVHRSQGHKSRLNAPYEKVFATWIDGLGVAPNQLHGNPQGKPPMIFDSFLDSADCRPTRRKPVVTGAGDPSRAAARSLGPRQPRRSC